VIILLDIDGVLVTTPAWRPVELLADGFLSFNKEAANNLSSIIDQTKASVVLTTTHRINYSIEEWQKILETRGINPASISKINDVAEISGMSDRATEIEEWIFNYSGEEAYVVIDDDLSLNRLPKVLKERCVLTKPMIGLDQETASRALSILLGNARSPV